jgi:hypothetical protein
MQSTMYRRTFPGTRLDARKSAAADFETTKGGFRLTTPVGGTLTGRGGSGACRSFGATQGTRQSAVA